MKKPKQNTRKEKKTPNWEKPSSDYPTRKDVRKEERKNDRREQQYRREESSVNDYLSSHPSASWAEAQYYSRKK